MLRKALDCEFEDQGEKGRSKMTRMTWRKQVEEESVKVGLSREDAFC